MRKIIFLIVFTYVINNVQAQALSNDQLISYSMDKYWADKPVASLYEDKYQLKMIEVFNNYKNKQHLYVQIHSVCQGANFLGNVYTISYRDQDHLGKLRLFMSQDLIFNVSAVEKNKSNIAELEKIHDSNPTKFNPIEGLNAISTYGLTGSNVCGK